MTLPTMVPLKEHIIYIFIREPCLASDSRSVKFGNYTTFSNSELLLKIFQTIYQVDRKDIFVIARGVTEEYSKMIQLTQGMLLTKLNKEKVLYQGSSHQSFIYFKTNQEAYKIFSDLGMVNKNKDIILFLLDNGSMGKFSDLHYIKIYDCLLSGNPRSLQILSDSCNGGSLIAEIRKYKDIFLHVSEAFGIDQKKADFVDASFLKHYLFLVQKFDFEPFINNINRITDIINESSSELMKLLSILKPKISSVLPKLDPQKSNLPFSDYVAELFCMTTSNIIIYDILEKLNIQTNDSLRSLLLVLIWSGASNSKQTNEEIIKTMQSKINQTYTQTFFNYTKLFKGKNLSDLYEDIIKMDQKIDLSHIHRPPEKERIFSTSGIDNSSSSFAGVHVTPRLIAYAGSPGLSEVIHEFFLRDTNENINLDLIKRNIEKSTEGSNENHHPLYISTENLGNDRYIQSVKDSVVNKMLQINELNGLIIKILIEMRALFEGKIPGPIELEKYKCDEKDNYKEKDKEEWIYQTASARISEKEITEISKISLISALSMNEHFDTLSNTVEGFLNSYQKIITKMIRLVSNDPIEAALISLRAMIDLSSIANDVLKQYNLPSIAAFRITIINKDVEYYSTLAVLRSILLSKGEAIVKSVHKLLERSSKDISSRTLKALLDAVAETENIGVGDIIKNNIISEMDPFVRELSQNVIKLIEIDPLICYSYFLHGNSIKPEQVNSLNSLMESDLIPIEKVQKFKDIIKMKTEKSKILESAVTMALRYPFIMNVDKDFSESALDMVIKDGLLAFRDEYVNDVAHFVLIHELDPSFYDAVSYCIHRKYHGKVNWPIFKIIEFELKKEVLSYVLLPRNPSSIYDLTTFFPFNENDGKRMLIHYLNKIISTLQNQMKISDENQSQIIQPKSSGDAGEEERNNQNAIVGVQAAIKVINGYNTTKTFTEEIIKDSNRIVLKGLGNSHLTQLTEDDFLRLLGLGSLEMLNIDFEDDEYYFDNGPLNEASIQEKTTEEEPISDEYIDKLRDELFTNSKTNSFEDEIWLVFKNRFHMRLKEMNVEFNLDRPSGLSISGWSDNFNAELDKVYEMLPLSHVRQFWFFEKYIAELAYVHGDWVLDAMVRSFDAADRVVTPRHFGIKQFRDWTPRHIRQY